MIRIVERELLDDLPHDHPTALENRRDLHRINRLMGNYRWIDRALARHLKNGDELVELGAGGGQLARLISARNGVAKYTGIDRCPPPEKLPENCAWKQCDLGRCDCIADADIVIANFILHQFSADVLETMGRKIVSDRTRVIVANETLRRSHCLWLIQLGRAIGFSNATVHDGKVSVRAGFSGQELPHLLFLAPEQWRWQISTTLMGSYRLVAHRK